MQTGKFEQPELNKASHILILNNSNISADVENV
jgi:hypothetical protein